MLNQYQRWWKRRGVADSANGLTWRIAFAPDAREWRYPLPFAGELEWQVNGMSEAEIPLPDIPAGHMIVPSFASLERPGHRWWLDYGSGSCFTASFGREGIGPCSPADSDSGLHVTNDFFQTTREMSDGRLRLAFDGHRPPSDYLVAVSVRPVGIPVDVKPMPDAQLLDIPAKGQMAATRFEFSRHTGDTACVSMAMDYMEVSHPFHELVMGAYHRGTNTYGVWPQNLWAASRWGVLGAIETTADQDVLDRAISGRHPFVASIAYPEGDLDGSALPTSPGHMVIVLGIQDGRVVVYDSAARDTIHVPRHYDIAEFMRAWLATRGVYYLFAIPD